MSQLTVQILLGGGMIAIATALQALTIGVSAMLRPHLARRLGRLRLWLMTGVIAGVALWMLTGMMLGVWLWALALIQLEAFGDLEQALYFAMASYTTLGYGDVLPPQDWRVFGALIGANGMIGFGLATAAMVEFVTRLRDELIN